MKNCIYFFTGTGNCLKLARDIAERLPDCELIAIKKGISITVPSGCERIGFVYPVYYLGLPAMVADFLKQADFPGQDQTYYFAVATYGEFAGSSIPELNRLLMNKGIILNYGAVLKMFSNCVTMYNMRKNVAEITGQSKQRSGPVIQAICEREYQPASGFGRVVDCYHRLQISRVRLISRSFQVSRDCVSCGI